MTVLSLEDFENHVGKDYRLSADEGPTDLRLDIAEALRDSGRQGGAFRLEFAGPRVPILAQGAYRFSRDDFEAQIFIVPVAQNEDEARYEAVFY